MTEEARVSTRASADDERVPSKSARVSTMGWLSFFTMFAIGTDTFLVAPLLPLLQRELDVPLSRAGWLVSAYALGYALFALVAGPVSDRHDRRRSSSPAWRPSPSSPARAVWSGASGAWSPLASWPA